MTENIKAALRKLTDECQDLAEDVGDQLHAFDQRLSALETAVYRTEAISIKLLESVRRANSEGTFVYLDKQLMALDERLMTVEKRLDDKAPE